jgi:hypothetical protein
MAYRVYSRIGIRFLGNSSPSKMEVHDLTKEKLNCQIDEILRAGHAVGLQPDSLITARLEGYDNCAWCIGGSTR